MFARSSAKKLATGLSTGGLVASASRTWSPFVQGRTSSSQHSSKRTRAEEQASQASINPKAWDPQSEAIEDRQEVEDLLLAVYVADLNVSNHSEVLLIARTCIKIAAGDLCGIELGSVRPGVASAVREPHAKKRSKQSKVQLLSKKQRQRPETSTERRSPSASACSRWRVIGALLPMQGWA